jgi:hypothetical protein
MVSCALALAETEASFFAGFLEARFFFAMITSYDYGRAHQTQQAMLATEQGTTRCLLSPAQANLSPSVSSLVCNLAKHSNTFPQFRILSALAKPAFLPTTQVSQFVEI